MEPIVQNAGALKLPPRSISVISVKAPIKLNTKHINPVNATDDLLSGIIPLAVDHKMDHKYLKLLKIPLFNTEHHTKYIQRKTIIGILQPIEIEILKSAMSHGPEMILIKQIVQWNYHLCHLNNVFNQNIAF